MATSPARHPLSVMPMSGLPSISHATTVALSVPAAAAVFVVTRISEIAAGSTPIVLPGLKPNQPNHSTKQPIVARLKLWPGIALIFPLRTVLAHARAQDEHADQGSPAANRVDLGRAGEVDKALVASSQPPPQIQWPTTG